MQYWLLKTEPSSYSIDDLKRDGRTFWNGVRNYQARNLMRDDIKVGDLVLFYHSNADPSGIVGVAKVVKEGYPDFTAWDSQSKYFDPNSSPEKPIWFMIDIAFVEKFQQILSLEFLKKHTKLDGLMLLKKGSRLSVQPVSSKHFKYILNIKQL